MKIVPDTTLEEDDNQGEMDVIFFVSLVTYTIYLCLIDIIYPDPVHLKQVGDFNLVMSCAVKLEHVVGLKQSYASSLYNVPMMCLRAFRSAKGARPAGP